METLDIPGYGEALNSAKLPPYVEHFHDGIRHEVGLDGTERWLQGADLHSCDGRPSLIVCSPIGTITSWHRYGKLHRDDDLPARTISDGTREWYRNGELHRDRGPARVTPKCLGWYKDGKLHRDGDLPAVVTDVCQEWWWRGNKHRSGGKPAVMCTSMVARWFTLGVEDILVPDSCILGKVGDRSIISGWIEPKEFTLTREEFDRFWCNDIYADCKECK